MIHDGSPVRQTAPTPPAPMPHPLNMKFARRLKLRLRDKILASIKQVDGPDPAEDDSLVELRNRDDENIAANVLGNELRNDLALAISPVSKPPLNSDEHVARWKSPAGHGYRGSSLIDRSQRNGACPNHKHRSLGNDGGSSRAS